MESRNGNNTHFFEGSGYITTAQPSETTLLHGKSAEITTTFSYETNSAMNSDLPSFEDIMDDKTMLLQTNILLTAVLVVCFATFAAVIAVCICFMRRHCRNQRISHPSGEQYHTTLVSKATSMTGLHAPTQEYFSTKIEKSKDISSVDDQCNQVVTCELGQGRSVKSTPDIFSPEFSGPVSPEQAAPIYFRIKNVLTSTPTSANCINDVVDTHSPPYTEGRVDSQADNQHMVFSLATTPSIYTSAFSDHKHNGAQHNRTSEHHSLPDSGNERDELHVRCLTKGPQTQSVSWFVPLNGIQREPLRHSVVDLSDEEVGIDDVASSPDSRPMSAKRYRKSRKPGNAPLTEEVESEKSYKHKGELVLCDLENLAPSEASTVLAENMPLMVDKENFHLGSLQVEPVTDESNNFKRGRLKSALSENVERGENEVNARSRSLSSPDEKTMWKQREERPVLFLGADSK